jgi:hypothetical protein
MTAPAKAGAPAKGPAKNQQPVRPRSFLTGTQPVLEGGDYDNTYVMTNVQNAAPWNLQATGWLRGLHLLCTGTGLTAGTVAADAPFNAFSNIQLNDVNNEAIFGPFDGYTAMLTNKYGGYIWAGDPGTSAIFALSGTTSTNNFTFVLYIPLEIVSRDPLGPVASVNNTASLTLVMALNATATIFSAPTGVLSMRIRGTQSFYWEPKLADRQGRKISDAPPAAGTTQYWTQGSSPIAGAGMMNQPINTGLGYPWRMYGFLYRDATGSRANGETAWPAQVTGIKFEANMLRSSLDLLLWKQLISEATGHTNPTADTRAAGAVPGKENGWYPLFFNGDFYLGHPGGETRRSYLQTSAGSNWILNANMGAAGNLYSVVNYIAPAGGSNNRGDTASLTNGQ